MCNNKYVAEKHIIINIIINHNELIQMIKTNNSLNFDQLKCISKEYIWNISRNISGFQSNALSILLEHGLGWWWVHVCLCNTYNCTNMYIIPKHGVHIVTLAMSCTHSLGHSPLAVVRRCCCPPLSDCCPCHHVCCCWPCRCAEQGPLLGRIWRGSLTMTGNWCNQNHRHKLHTNYTTCAGIDLSTSQRTFWQMRLAPTPA